MIIVKNKNSYGGDGLYVGRPSVFGNPFVLGRDGSRQEVIEKYRRFLWRVLQDQKEPLYSELLRLSQMYKDIDLILICHCNPLSCHADVLKSCLEYLQKG